MNTEIKKIRKFCCSTCGVEGHNKNNTKFHPAVPADELYTEWIVEVKGEEDGEHYFQQDEKRAILFYTEVIGNFYNRKITTALYASAKLVKLTTISNPDRDDDGKEIQRVIICQWEDHSKESFFKCETCSGFCDRLIEYCGLKGEEWQVCEDCEIKFDEERIQNIDDPDMPNIYPYKKCSECEGRSSCGSYDKNMYWLCEGCTPEEEEEEVGDC
jgi:hypothetical protein